MRSLLVVKNEKGETKIQHFMNLDLESAYEREIDDISYFIADRDKMCLLRKRLPNIGYFKPEEQGKYSGRLMQGKRRETEYYLKFLDSRLNTTEFINNIISNPRKHIKLYKHNYTDFLFVENLCEINYKIKKAYFYYRGILVKTMQFEA